MRKVHPEFDRSTAQGVIFCGGEAYDTKNLDQRLNRTRPNRTTEEVAFREARAADLHYSWHIRQRLINTFVYNQKRPREVLVTDLRRRYPRHVIDR